MKSVIAAFRDSESAQVAAAELRAAGFGACSLRVIEHSYGSHDLVSTLETRGVPEHRSQLYAEALHRGGALIICDADDAHADEIAAFLDEHGSLDLEDEASRWMPGTSDAGIGTAGLGPSGVGDLEPRHEPRGHGPRH